MWQKLEVVRKLDEPKTTQKSVAKHFSDEYNVTITQKNVSIWKGKHAELERIVAETGGHERHIRSV
jgi:hypothetical protein